MVIPYRRQPGFSNAFSLNAIDDQSSSEMHCAVFATLMTAKPTSGLNSQSGRVCCAMITSATSATDYRYYSYLM